MSDMPRKNAATKYYKLSRDTDGFLDSQFKKPPPKIPFKAIALASILFLGGTILLVVGSLLLTGYIDVKYADRTWPVLILGGIMFIPGAYHVRIAYCAFRGYQGYSYDDIPEFE